ncbi:DUF2023 family protein [Methanolobus sp. ZRKC2]|uniref:DUF2023 family protein n=1 Tax=Methanolobus sp. ZRKC2 TaxID=3125783 RepID=UPI0032440D44
MNNIDEELLKTHLHGNMQILRHHVYEYQKGIRHLILHTSNITLEDEIISLLEKKNVSYLIRSSSNQKINVFFGDRRCIDILERIGEKSLSDFTDEEDFILGIMLGYDQIKQCERYIKRKEKEDIAENKVVRINNEKAMVENAMIGITC